MATHIKLNTSPGNIRERALLKRNVHLPYPNIKTLSPTTDADKAKRSAEDWAEDYQNKNWPGGMGTVVAIIEWEDGTFSGIVNYYYSNS